MKKIMFNDKYGLTQAVLEGRKTQTRRIVNSDTLRKALMIADIHGRPLEEFIKEQSFYLYSEEVAVAQSYEDVSNEVFLFATKVRGKEHRAGCGNKMFVRAHLMPHRIKITNVRVERLQDISDEDCLKEGVFETPNKWYAYEKPDKSRAKRPIAYSTPRLAFAALIDKTCKRGTWDRNPWVFVYDFELVK